MALCEVAVAGPRRDLADNWDVDIAQELEDYLEELESIQISVDGGKSSLNFAEAALLIQVRCWGWVGARAV